MIGPIDYEHVSELKDLLGKQELLSIVDTFASHAQEMMQDVERLNEESKIQQLVVSLHSLKGSCKNVGAEMLAESFAVLEREARKGVVENLGQKLPKLKSQLSITASALQSYVNSQ